MKDVLEKLNNELRYYQNKCKEIEIAISVITDINLSDCTNDLTIKESIINFLSKCDKPMRSCDIAKGVLEDGYKTSSKNFIQNVTTTLRRHQSQFKQVGKKAGWLLINKN